MKKIEIQQPNGVLYDSDGNIAHLFGNFEVGTHQFPDYVDESQGIEYVDDPSFPNHTLHWQYGAGIPPLSVSLSATQLVNDGTDSVDVTVSLPDDATQEYDATLNIDGTDFVVTVGPSTDATETITTTKPSGATIDVQAVSDNLQNSHTVTIDVVSQ